MLVTDKQYAVLSAPLNTNRIRRLEGQSHLEAWDVRRYLIRVFGFGGFDIDTKSLEMVKETEHPPGTIKRKNGSTNDRTAWSVIYRAQVRLTLKNPAGEVIAYYEDGATGDATNQPVLGDAHDLAMKTALSQALKRCTVNLGDQFGLSLYNKGNTDAVVLWTAVSAPTSAKAAAVPEDAPVEGGELDEPAAVEEVMTEAVAEDFPAPEPVLGAGSDPSAIRAHIKAAGEAKSLTIMEIAEDFHEWSKGEQIGQAKSDVLFEYLQFLTAQRAA